tara:strand:+ start:4372 stop:4761 length:390 start_codon:yes stop_codon:yes gene_type:complete
MSVYLTDEEKHIVVPHTHALVRMHGYEAPPKKGDVVCGSGLRSTIVGWLKLLQPLPLLLFGDGLFVQRTNPVIVAEALFFGAVWVQRTHTVIADEVGRHILFTKAQSSDLTLCQCPRTVSTGELRRIVR